ncbi:MAG TPA: peptidyl-alpha-hydroxyglycine alpha-amidating lyase family protein [Acetobacteraceae bacterium]
MMRAAFSALLLLGSAAHAQTTPPQIPYTADAEFLKLPDTMFLGEVSGVAVNAGGHVFVFNRGNTRGPAYAAAAAQLLEFGPDGAFIREVGPNLYAWSFAHDVKVDRDGNVWAADKGSDQVVRFNPAGRVTMVFGRKQEASDEDTKPLEHPKPPKPPIDGYFRQVTDITWDSKGNGYISDGYINSRVAKVSPAGEWLGSFGTPGDGPGQLNTPHSIASDAQDRIYVADRGNRRVQVFDADGNVLRQITIDVPFDPATKPAIGNKPDQNPPVGTPKTQVAGAPWTVCITPPPNQVLYVSDAYPGRIYKLSLDGKVLGYLGKSGKMPGEFGWIHQIACPSENTLFVAELLNWRVQKLELKPQ